MARSREPRDPENRGGATGELRFFLRSRGFRDRAISRLDAYSVKNNNKKEASIWTSIQQEMRRDSAWVS